MELAFNKLKLIRRYCSEHEDCHNCVYKMGDCVCTVWDGIDAYIANREPKEWEIEKLEDFINGRY